MLEMLFKREQGLLPKVREWCNVCCEEAVFACFCLFLPVHEGQ